MATHERRLQHVDRSKFAIYSHIITSQSDEDIDSGKVESQLMLCTAGSDSSVREGYGQVSTMVGSFPLTFTGLPSSLYYNNPGVITNCRQVHEHWHFTNLDLETDEVPYISVSHSTINEHAYSTALQMRHA